MNIYLKLDAARKLIRTKSIKKEGKNSYSNYDYFTPEQVEQLVADACEETKTICITSLRKDDLGYYQELCFIDLEATTPSSGVLVPPQIHFELRTDRPEIKATNATQQMGGMDTYSERYIKMKVFQIKDNNLDFDSQDNRPAPAPKANGAGGHAYLGVAPKKPVADKKTEMKANDSYQKEKDAVEHEMGDTEKIPF